MGVPETIRMSLPEGGQPGRLVPETVGTQTHPLIGVWSNDFKPEDDIDIVITNGTDGFDVKIMNKTSGERANVYDVTWDGESLSYNVYWRSNGRYLRCRIHLMRPGHVAYTYTYTTTEMWSTEPVA